MKSWSLLAVVVLLLGGCVRTIQPILKDEQVVIDKSLVGKWVSDDGTESVEISPPSEDKAHKVLYTDKDGKKGAFVVRLGKIGEMLIAEVRAEDPAPNAADLYKAHLIPLYS